MKKQISTMTPLVNIVMAIYNPRMDWLKEQLQSLNGQTYRNIKISIIDDCSNKVEFEDIEECVNENVTNFPYTIHRNIENLGSNKTFEKLTGQAEGEYIAYCDQDDIWAPEKIEIYVNEIVKKRALLVCSDMFIIDAQGKRKADSITKVRRHHVFKSGKGLAQYLLFSNFITGCAMMLKTEVAQNSIPFCPFMVHDHYLGLFSANQGSIAFIDKPLIYYRIHNSNQTLMMAGVYDKASYIKVRIQLSLKKFYWLEENFNCDEKLKDTIKQGIEWLIARKNNMNGIRRIYSGRLIWKYRRFSNLTSIFEIVSTYFPNKFFMLFISMKKKNII